MQIVLNSFDTPNILHNLWLQQNDQLELSLLAVNYE